MPVGTVCNLRTWMQRWFTIPWPDVQLSRRYGHQTCRQCTSVFLLLPFRVIFLTQPLQYPSEHMARKVFFKLNRWGVSITLPGLREPHIISLDGLVSESACSGRPSQLHWHRTSSIGFSVLQTLDFPWTWPLSSVAWLSGWSGVIMNSRCRRIGLFLVSFYLNRGSSTQTLHSLERIQSYLDIDHGKPQKLGNLRPLGRTAENWKSMVSRRVTLQWVNLFRAPNHHWSYAAWSIDWPEGAPWPFFPRQGWGTDRHWYGPN